MKMPIGVLAVCEDAIQRLIVQPLAPVDSFRLVMTVTPCLVALQKYNSLRLDLCRKYGIISQDASHFDFPVSEKREAFQRELVELQAEELEMEVRPILLSSLQKSNISISPMDLINLQWLIKEDLEEKEPKGE